MPKTYYRVITPLFAMGVPPVALLEWHQYAVFAPLFILFIGVLVTTCTFVKSKCVLEILHAATLYCSLFILGISLSHAKYVPTK